MKVITVSLSVSYLSWKNCFCSYGPMPNIFSPLWGNLGCWITVSVDYAHLNTAGAYVGKA